MSSAEFNQSEITPSTPSVPKPSKKRKQTQEEPEPETFKVEQSALLKFPVMTVSTGKKKRNKKDSKDDGKSPQLITHQMSTTQSSVTPLRQLSTDPVPENG